ncbi:MAG: Nicotinate dehydrogenase subunit B [Gemmatimonadaceae bacterium]|nr:Nicotinate dehydrogenase subunit B [Gemmatimonadaceae bacterium]
MIRKGLLTLGSLILIVLIGGATFVASRQHLTFDVPYPDVTASTDSTVIERGRYLVRDAAPCAGCHGDPAQEASYAAGADVPLSGGFVFDIPPGKFYAHNITSDDETGLGKVSDKAIGRALRYGVGYDGRALLPFMEMQGLADDDVVAVVSYLRTLPPTRKAVPPHEFSLLGRVLMATALAKPIGPAATPPARAPRSPSIETGRYLVESVAICRACHTQRDNRTGELVGPHLGGAAGLTETDDPAHSWSAPNITSDPETGKLAQWTEDQFVLRFKQGRILDGSPMPWPGLSKLTEDDLRSMYRYLRSVPPVKNDVGPPLVMVKP